MHGASVQEAVATSTLVRSHLAGTLRRAMSAAATALVPAVVSASMTMVTLPGLVKESTVIAYGHIRGASAPDQSQSPPTVTFEVVSLLKGKASSRRKKLTLCNPHDNSEWPDLSKKTGDLVVSVLPKGACLDLSHGWKSVITVVGGHAQTYMIEEEPHDQPLKVFVGKIRSLVAEEVGKSQQSPALDRSQEALVAYNLRFPGQYYTAQTGLHQNDSETTARWLELCGERFGRVAGRLECLCICCRCTDSRRLRILHAEAPFPKSAGWLPAMPVAAADHHHRGRGHHGCAHIGAGRSDRSHDAARQRCAKTQCNQQFDNATHVPLLKSRHLAVKTHGCVGG
jgi:hypothetical protein